MVPKISKPKPTLEDRFWTKVDKSGDCWEWTGSKVGNGYGLFNLPPTTSVAHRVAWKLTRGAIPKGVELDHTCHNRACVNPDHLQMVTRKENNENLVGAQRNSRSGVRGVSRKNSRWAARVEHNGQAIWVGSFPTIEEAEAAVIAKRNELFTNNLVDRRTIQR